MSQMHQIRFPASVRASVSLLDGVWHYAVQIRDLYGSYLFANTTTTTTMLHSTLRLHTSVAPRKDSEKSNRWNNRLSVWTQLPVDVTVGLDEDGRRSDRLREITLFIHRLCAFLLFLLVFVLTDVHNNVYQCVTVTIFEFCNGMATV